MVPNISFWALLTTILPAFGFWMYVRAIADANIRKRRTILNELGVSSIEHDKRTLIGFFHPYCNAGGGGERVLWTVIALLQRTDPNIISVVYSGDGDAGKEEIISKVKSRFDITLEPSTVHFVFLKSRHLVEDSAWPRFTLAGQSLGSMYLAYEAMTKLIPDIFIDTMGYAFTFHVVRWMSLGRVPVGAYVHYPTISTDMLARVRERKSWHTNDDTISSSATRSSAKLFYYRCFMNVYSHALRNASFLMANSTWTKSHIDAILSHQDSLLDVFYFFVSFVNPFGLLMILLCPRVTPPKEAKIVYPPCETRELTGFPLEGRERVILSVAQFRPEKDHSTQLRSLHELLSKYPEYRKGGKKEVKLVLIGGSRNEKDASRVEDLQKLARELHLEDAVEFVVNAPYSTVLEWLSRSSIGISTMVDEHFGINVVEYMAAGVIPVTHASGGPLHDIVVPLDGEPTGFHATSVIEYADALNRVLSLSSTEEYAMRERARLWAVRQFSREGFEKSWEGSGWRRWLPRK